MATLPTPPSFAANSVPSVSTLNQLGSSVSFVTQVPIVVSLKLSGTQAVTSATNTAVLWTVEETDTDSMHSTITNTSRLTCQTQGYYRFHANISFTTVSANQSYECWFQQTTGANNPLGAGQTQIWGMNGDETSASTSDTISVSICGMSPCLYVADYVEAYLWVGASNATIVNSFQQTANTDLTGFKDGGSCLTGYYVCEGP